jgi:uncharacterized protein (DUF1330 family)
VGEATKRPRAIRQTINEAAGIAQTILDLQGGDMTAYWIAHVTVLDPAKYKGYMDIAPQAFNKFGAVFLARGGASEVLEGESFERHVVIQFKDMQTALDCYHSPEYQAAKQKRDGHCRAQITIVEGLDA